jgi:DNA modification methylase
LNASLRARPNREDNKLRVKDRPAHDWYRFVLSFPPHLVRDYVARFGVTDLSQVLDPFCGTGTTIVECKKLGIPAVGVEAHPMAHFAARIKTMWSVDPDALLADAEEAAADSTDPLPLPAEAESLLLRGSISPLPLRKTLTLLAAINGRATSDHLKLALAKALVTTIGNLHFGPEVGVGPAKTDAPVVESWLANVRAIAADLRLLRRLPAAPATVYYADSRRIVESLPPRSIDAVITSPPYPNEKDYTRTTRLESVLLGFLKNKQDLKSLKRGLMRSNTRNVFKGDDDDAWIASHAGIQRIADSIEARRIELGKTSGFERLYSRVTRLYFGGMARHLQQLKTVLKPGAHLAYVVGDQASFLRVMIRTGQLLADIAANLGYKVEGIDLFRTRRATATGEQLREEVVVLRA